MRYVSSFNFNIGNAPDTDSVSRDELLADHRFHCFNGTEFSQPSENSLPVDFPPPLSSDSRRVNFDRTVGIVRGRDTSRGIIRIAITRVSVEKRRRRPARMSNGGRGYRPTGATVREGRGGGGTERGVEKRGRESCQYE